MATIKDRIAALEKRKALPPLCMVIINRPTPEQAANIQRAERTGQPVRTITVILPKE